MTIVLDDCALADLYVHRCALKTKSLPLVFVVSLVAATAATTTAAAFSYGRYQLILALAAKSVKSNC